MIDSKEYFSFLRSQMKAVMKKSRYEHTLGVEFTAAAMAMKYDVPINKARTAGLLHDCAKCVDKEQALRDCKKYNIELSDTEIKNNFLIHSKLGAVYAKHLYDIDDEEIISAIRWHTTGKPQMNFLEKIVFISDYIEPGRDKAPNLEEIRRMAFTDIDETMYLILRDTLSYIKHNKNELDEITTEAYKYYKELHDRKTEEL